MTELVAMPASVFPDGRRVLIVGVLLTVFLLSGGDTAAQRRQFKARMKKVRDMSKMRQGMVKYTTGVVKQLPKEKRQELKKMKPKERRRQIRKIVEADIKKRIGTEKPKGALYISCLGRGKNLFGDNSEELKMISDVLGEIPLVGFYANGEIAGNQLYGYTGVLTVFL